MKHKYCLLLPLILLVTSAQAQNKRDIAVREDKATLANDDSWFYDELQPAFDEAERSRRPLMIVFR